MTSRSNYDEVFNNLGMQIKNHCHFFIKAILISILIGIAINLLLGSGDSFSTFRGFGILVLFSTMFGVPLFYINIWISRYLNRKISWIHYPLKRFLYSIIFTVGSCLIIYAIMNIAIFSLILHHPIREIFRDTFAALITVSIATVLIAGFFHSFEFLKRWKAAVVNEERLKREAISLQFESLKNQVNPHFLFNSLNVLTSLIPKDPEASIRFVKQLSDVYRYVLEQNAKDTTDIADELRFLNSYVYLQKIRFNESFQINIDITEQHFQIVPLALQMLLENAIKHNIVSDEMPLIVKIYDSEDYLIVENNLQKKSAAFDSNQIGLKNIQFRYEFLSENKMEVTDTDGKFVVKIPKLKTV